VKILVVEDFEDTRYMIKVWLELKGHNVTEAVNGQQAIEIAPIERPNLILMDLNMPGIDGFAATRQILEQSETQSIPVIAVSAHLGQEWRDKAIAAGCLEFLAKPVDFKKLEALIERVSQMNGAEVVSSLKMQG
jgi:two-component system, cell cycle response regulator DivK